jgi:hypothetical protein
MEVLSRPWYYGTAIVVSRIAVVASVVSVISGIAVGVGASAYHPDGDDFVTKHHPGVILEGIVGGIFLAALWLAVAVGVRLLSDIATSAGAIADPSGGTLRSVMRRIDYENRTKLPAWSDRPRI